MSNVTVGEIADTVAVLAAKKATFGTKLAKIGGLLALVWFAIQTVVGLYVGIMYPYEVMAFWGIN